MPQDELTRDPTMRDLRQSLVRCGYELVSPRVRYGHAFIRNGDGTFVVSLFLSGYAPGAWRLTRPDKREDWHGFRNPPGMRANDFMTEITFAPVELDSMVRWMMTSGLNPVPKKPSWAAPDSFGFCHPSTEQAPAYIWTKRGLKAHRAYCKEKKEKEERCLARSKLCAASEAEVDLS